MSVTKKVSECFLDTEKNTAIALGRITDIPRLVMLLQFTSDEKIARLIAKRIKEAVPEVSDLTVLIGWRNYLLADHTLRKHSEKFVTIILSRIRELIRDRLPETADMKTLVSWWDNSAPGSETESMIESRMLVVLKPQIDNVSNMFALLRDWLRSYSDSELRTLILNRAIEISEAMDATRPPDWYRRLYSNPHLIPSGFHKQFKKNLVAAEKAFKAD